MKKPTGGEIKSSQRNQNKNNLTGKTLVEGRKRQLSKIQTCPVFSVHSTLLENLK
jgi:hypothetical protein